jgi:hypothetical protein
VFVAADSPQRLRRTLAQLRHLGKSAQRHQPGPAAIGDHGDQTAARGCNRDHLAVADGGVELLQLR